MVNRLDRLSNARQSGTDKDVQLLGRRHEYNGDKGGDSLAASARLIGFSQAEVVELERLYRRDSEGRKT